MMTLFLDPSLRVDMQDLVSILFDAFTDVLLATKPGRHLAIAALIAFASGVAVSIMTKDIVAARWAFFGAFPVYLAFACIYAALPRKTSLAAPDRRQKSDPLGGEQDRKAPGRKLSKR